MMKRFALGGMVIAVLASIGGGWTIWSLRDQQHRTLEQLQQTQTALTQKQQTLAMLQDEHQKLSDSYDALKKQWAESDQHVKELSRTSEQLTKQLEQLNAERESLQSRLEDAKGQSAALDQRVKTLKQEIASGTQQNTLLAQQVQETAQRSLSQAELEQLAEAMGQAREHTQELDLRIQAMTHDYEQLLTLQQAAAQTDSASRRQHLTDAQRPSRSQSAKQFAKQYRNLGDAYMAMYQYPKAAEAFERSLVFENDRDLHAKLAFIYSRLLHDREKAERHLGASRGFEPANTAFSGVARAQGLPRQDWQLVWQTLTE